MKLFSANIEDLRTLYITSLKKALDMENNIVDALPTMVEKSTDPELANAFRTHLEESRGHARDVASLLRNASGDADTETCKAIRGLVTEAQDMIKDAKDSSIRDISLISAGQQVEHHEIAVYGTLRTWAEILGLSQDVPVLESILENEKATDEKLSSIAESANMQAA